MNAVSFLTTELKTRIVTAVVLAAIVIGTLATGSSALWALLVLVFCLAAGWECLRLILNLSSGAKALSWAFILGGLGFLVFALFDKDVAGRDPLISKALTGLLLIASAFWQIGRAHV